MVAFGDAELSMVVLNKIDTLVPQSAAPNTSKRSDPNAAASGGGTGGGLNNNGSKSSSNFSSISTLSSSNSSSASSIATEGGKVGGEESALSSPVLGGLRRKTARLRRVVHDLFVPLLPILSPSTDTLPEPWLLETIARVLDDAFAGIWVLKKEQTRALHAAAVLGPGVHLGVISPTQWPDPEAQRLERAQLGLHDDHYQVAGEGRGNREGVPLNALMAVYRGAEKWINLGKTVQQSNDSSGSDDSSSEGVSSEYESDCSVATSVSRSTQLSQSASSVDDEVEIASDVSDSMLSGGESVEEDVMLDRGGGGDGGDGGKAGLDPPPEEEEELSGEERSVRGDGSSASGALSNTNAQSSGRKEAEGGAECEGKGEGEGGRSVSSARRSGSPPLSDITRSEEEEEEDDASRRSDSPISGSSRRSTGTSLEKDDGAKGEVGGGGGADIQNDEGKPVASFDPVNDDKDTVKEGTISEKEETEEARKGVGGEGGGTTLSLEEVDGNITGATGIKETVSSSNAKGGGPDEVAVAVPEQEGGDKTVEKKPSRWGWGKKK
jgi:hypothetical protein